MFHDMGLTHRHSSACERFEVDGANAARGFLQERGIAPSDIDTVWTAIALHTTPGIPQHMHPVVALVTAGVEMDVLGLSYGDYSDAERDLINQARPFLIQAWRNAIEHTALRDAVAARLPGIARCRIPRILRLDRGVDVSVKALSARLDFPFPVLARPVGTHGGDDFEKIEDVAALAGFLAQRPESDHYVIEYVDYGSADGHFRKYRFIFVGKTDGVPRYYDMVRKFGLGQRTGVGLPGESEGLVPPIDQWSGSTFSNLPIGQGLSMTLLQMTGMYQAIANDGVRIPPRIIKSTVSPDGARTEEPRPEGVRVVSPETARTVRNMLRGVVQRDPTGTQQGTGPAAAVDGYQVSGKTGTAQQINPACGCYYDNVYWITFAGMATTDDPRYVIGVMMDNPSTNADGTPGHSAAPLFHNIAGWLLQRGNVPLSADPGPPLTLQAM